MRISTITNWAYGITLALTAASAEVFMLSADAADRERRAVEQHLTLGELGEELALGVEERSDAARIYIMRGNQEQLKAFRTDEGEETRREGAIKGIRSTQPSDVEFAALDEIERDADALDQIEEKALPVTRLATRLVHNQSSSAKITIITKLYYSRASLWVPQPRTGLGCSQACFNVPTQPCWKRRLLGGIKPARQRMVRRKER